jgi:hypothetical protein
MLINQNFSIPADDDAIVSFVVDESVVDITTLQGSEIWWNVYPMQYACPVPGQPALITKTNQGGSLDIEIPASPALTFYVSIYRADTIALLRNYYHEARILNPQQQLVTVAVGIMTVLPSEGRPA